jgi:hypothetical protein
MMAELTTDAMDMHEFVNYACGRVQMEIGTTPLRTIMFGLMLAVAQNTKFGGQRNNPNLKTPEASAKPRRGKRTTKKRAVRKVARSRRPKETQQ